jgi:hypothetical protein
MLMTKKGKVCGTSEAKLKSVTMELRGLAAVLPGEILRAFYYPPGVPRQGRRLLRGWPQPALRLSVRTPVLRRQLGGHVSHEQVA